MKLFLLSLLAIGAIGAAAVIIYARNVPADLLAWHVDPVTAPDPDRSGVQVVPPDAPVFNAAPVAVLAAVGRVAEARARVSHVAGDPGTGQVTYLERSRVFGFVDFITFRAVAAEDGTALAILSRSRIGGYDWGANARRVGEWTEAIRTALGTP